MTKTHWKPRRRFGMAGGRHSRTKTVKSRYDCSIVCGLKMTFKKCNSKKKTMTSFKRKLLSCYVKKEVLSKQYRSRLSTDSLVLKLKALKPVNVKGYRMINIDCLEKYLNVIVKHSLLCSKAAEFVEADKPVLEIESEIRKQGLACVLGVRCIGCKTVLTFETSPKIKTDKSSKYDINVRAVWGSIVTGNGSSHLQEIMATMDAPSLTQPAFTNIEQEIGNLWEDISQEELLAAGAEERRLAIEKGQYHKGVPCIAVIADGGWSKRSHKHSYNALGGVGVIIGKETGKLLHIGIRNKYCYICSRVVNSNMEVPEHICYKNWEASSQSMESDIIVEGFKKAEQMHGLRYMWLVGDGDSSVFAKIKQEVPVWGSAVLKIECANHVCKCLRSNLEKLVESNPQYKGRNKLTKSTRVRIVSAVRCAIRMRSKQATVPGERKKASTQLAKDIRNSIHHIFGNHSSCSDFCKHASKPPIDLASASEDSEKTCEQPDQLCTSLSLLWSEGSSIQHQEESRFGYTWNYDNLDSVMLNDISVILNRIADKSERLIDNTTTNLAECWMHMRSKFDGGKVYNLCNRGSWHTRCYGGSLRQNLGVHWSPVAWKKCTATPAGENFINLYINRDKQLRHSQVCKQTQKSTSLRWKRKMATLKDSQSAEARQSYGPESLDAQPDISPDELSQRQSHFISQHINITPDKLKAIEFLTQSQFQSQVWHDERRKRITASNFGTIIKRKTSIPVKKLVENLVYGTFKGNCHTRCGLKEETSTIHEYILKKAEEGINVTVSKSGLVISDTDKFLGGSPDGVVYEKEVKCGLIEIKNLLLNKPFNLTQAAKSSSNFCLKLYNGKLQLKPNHNYYYQCQGLLHICKMPWIDFIVRTLNPYQLHIERIYKNNSIWKDWVKKLNCFYHKALLPELAAPRKGLLPGIREPGIWCEDIKQVRKPRQPATEQIPSCSYIDKTDNQTPSCSYTEKQQKRNTSRKRRISHTKFLGRRIAHEWAVSEDHKTEWYTGTVTAVVSGTDGSPTAVYEVIYDGGDESYEIDHLHEDYLQSSVKFIDI